ncbi:MAG: LacI family DNA-binding transcriptional regulator [Bryobacteraceae bacterium]
MKKSRPHATLAEVAQLAGVGKATVSRVINGAHKVSPHTLERINTVIQELGYHPSQAARSLKGDRTKTLGLILPRISDPFFASCAEAVQSVARSHDYLLMVVATDYDRETEVKELYTLLRHRVDGILISPTDGLSNKLSEIIDEIKIPVVTFNHPLLKARVRSVLADNYLGARSATDHLVAHGRRRILCLGGDSSLYSIRERQRGYKKATRSAGLKTRIEESVNDYAGVESVLRAQCQREKPIDAIFGVRNLITIYAFQVLQVMGLRIGEEVALIGFDDFDLACTLTPSVTVVRQPIEDMATQAANLLFEQMRSKTIGKPTRITLQTNLIVRSSCGCHGENR